MEELNLFTKYKKYSSPFKKDEKFKNTEELSQSLPTGDWIVTEKIDGTNIRIIIDKDKNVHFGSRKLILNPEDKSSKIFMDCVADVNVNKLIEYFKEVESTVVIYGEGYGAGIQKGGIYSPVKNFRVFDIRIGDAYQDWEFIEKVCIANQLNMVPKLLISSSLNYSTCTSILSNFKKTMILDGDGGEPEGVVFKFNPTLLNKYGERLIFKVKFKDFEGLE